MNITKGKLKKILKKGNKKQTNKINKKVRFRKNNSNNRSLKKRNNKVNLRVKTLKYGGVNKKGKRAAKEKADRDRAEIEKMGKSANPNTTTKPKKKKLHKIKKNNDEVVSQTQNPLINDTSSSTLGSKKIEAQKKFQERQNKIKHDNDIAKKLREQNELAKKLLIAPGSNFKPETPEDRLKRKGMLKDIQSIREKEIKEKMPVATKSKPIIKSPKTTTPENKTTLIKPPASAKTPVLLFFNFN